MAGLDHLAVIARRLLPEHGLTVEEVKHPKFTLKRLKAMPSLRKVEFLPGGREKWGPDYQSGYADCLKRYKKDLAIDYPRDRAWWPTAISTLVRDGGYKLTPDRPWLAWYEAILGEPYTDFPPEMDWKALIHQVWLDRTREWRWSWEHKFLQQYREAEDMGVLEVGPGQGNIWNEWRLLSYIQGFATVEGLWEQQTFERLAREQDVAEIFAAVDKQPA